ncbi:glycosyltransferase family 9 protein [Flaviaesturariibacter flavus]|uniref:Glycosyltransferase family 9 protein n=1 Tax=Flaviaesturariibacter flavus TaxID=2502780 RepID=A0A4R1BK38_9BACT|nr:glycosyltransferase family 9 protein [Flaviaesturariibacter flavus]TCJ17669.1 glycosyltransferase family 9 protein [Flaviaesturariibacter flavus]
MARAHLLVFRFSSLGDVAMTVPVLRLALAQNPELEVTYVSTAFVRPLFDGIPRLRFVAADLKGRHKGVPGLYRLFRELRSQERYTGIADLHNVLRTKILRAYFRFTGIPAAALDKGRAEKKELTRAENKQLRPLKPMHRRYAEVFGALGCAVELSAPYAFPEANVPPDMRQGTAAGIRFIGIAPFAAFREKTYPPELMAEAIRHICRDEQNRVFLFGGKGDAAQFDAWQQEIPRVRNLAGKMSFGEELDHIGGLDVMISMDSANMHLASLYGVPVVSVWGGTHPWLGFYGWRQDPANAVQIELACRPSSVFGNKDCPNDRACMRGIAPLLIAGKVFKILQKGRS